MVVQLWRDVAPNHTIKYSVQLIRIQGCIVLIIQNDNVPHELLPYPRVKCENAMRGKTEDASVFNNLCPSFSFLIHSTLQHHFPCCCRLHAVLLTFLLE
jgi:hypothetical protein